MKHIVNQNGYFFSITPDAALDVADLLHAHQFNDARTMAEWVAEETGEELDELLGAEMIIKVRDGRTICVDARGCVEYVDDCAASVAEFINDYQI